MPIPTDTFRNIRRLNWVFAGTAVLMMALMGASVMQDFNKSWRQPQRSGEVWEAALVDEKVAHSITPEKKKRLDELSRQITQQQAEIDAHEAETAKIQSQIAKIRSDTSTKEFTLNNEKATLAVAEAGLEQARTAAATPDETRRVAQMEQEIRPKREFVANETEQIKAWQVDLERLNGELGRHVGALADLKKQQTKLQAEDVALKKKREALQPRSMIAKVSTIVRRTPLMQFINPAERVQQDVLPDVRTDVAFQKITTIDRCRTCHVNIEDKQFREGDVLAFLERNVAEARGLKLPGNRPTRPADPQATADQPGAAAMGEFWHAWGVEMGPAVVRRNAARIKAVADTVGKGVTVTVDGSPVPSFAYDINVALTRTDATAAARQDRVLVQLLKAWAAFEPGGADKNAVAARSESAGGRGNGPAVKVEITNGAVGAPAARAAALKYPEDVRTGLESSLDKDERRMLLDQYRRSLTAVVNAARDERGEPALDDGRVMLAHPNLDLYVGVDSKHSFEKVGCTSCHDGSGQETDFVLSAHAARAVWVDQKTGALVLPEQIRDLPAEHHRATLASMLEAVFPEGALAPVHASSLTMPLPTAHGSHAADAGHGAAPAVEANPTGAPAGEHAAAKPPAGAAHPATAPAPAKTDFAVQLAGPREASHAHIPDDAAPVTYEDPVTRATGRAVPQIQYWSRKYQSEAGTGFETVHERWDWPMRPPQYLEANCVRCHTQASDIREDAPVLNEGRTLFTNMGCVNCHQMDSIPAEQKRQVGTDLRHVTEKLSAEFINTWVWAPKAFRPSTKMPHFFLLENNSAPEEIRRTRQEARSITEYLVRTATPTAARPQLAPTAQGSKEAGQTLFETVGCLGCHVNLNAPAKTGGGTVGQQWITTDLIKSGELAERLETVVAAETAAQLTSGLEATVEANLVDAAKKQVTDAVRKELTPKAPTGAAARTAPKPTAQEKAALDARIAAEAEKRFGPAIEQARKGLPAAIEKARRDLPTTIATTVAKNLTDRVKLEAQNLYDAMSYNERQLYLAEKLEPPSVILEKDPTIPWRNEAAGDPSPFTLKTYPDGTPKPVFMHHGPELSGIGTKLEAGRTPAQARAWLFGWLKEPHHYSSYTLMPNLRLTDQQALDLTEYLLAQKREANKKGDAWKAELTPEDPSKLSELMSLFLRSRFSVKTADRKAVEEFDPAQPDGYGEVTRLAVEALTTPATPKAAAEAQVKQMNLAQKQMAWLGKKLISHYGCMSCHQINGMETATSPCANLSDWGQKAVTKLDYAYLDHHKHVGAEALPETYAVTLLNGLSEHAVDLAHAGPPAANGAAPTTGPATAPTAAAGPAGSAAASAHDAGPAPRAPAAHAPEGHAADADASVLAVGWPHVGHSREEWITQKLKNSRVYDRGKNLLEPGTRRGESGRLENPGRPYDKLRMPTFYLSEKQVDAIVTFVISNRDRLISETLTQKASGEDARRIAYGRFLTQRYNCVSCHQIERNAPPVQQYYTPEQVVTKAPPSLRGEGNKIRHDWLFNFLRNVEPLRPLPQIRMPSFRFTDDAEVTAIAAYFATLSNREARDLKRNVDLVLAHIEGPKKAADKGGAATPPATQPVAAVQPGVSTTQPSKTLGAPSGAPLTANAAGQPAAAKSAAAPVADAARKPWFLEETLDTQRRYLEDWALDHKQLTLTQIDPARNSAEELQKGYGTLLFKARFTAELYDAPYPFADASVPRVSQERFAKGERLFFEMQCLKCHMFGEVRPDEKVPPSVVAPNLSLAHQRLQRRWVRHWVQEPPIIQVGTAMPPFLSGLAALKLDGLSWPRSQMLSEPETQRIESAYGATPDEQAALLLDFLYSAGARNYTPVQPAGGVAGVPSPAPLPQGAPPTANQPASAGDPTVGGPSNAAVDKAPVQPGTNKVPPEKKQEMENPQKPAATPAAPAPASPTPAPQAAAVPGPSVPSQPMKAEKPAAPAAAAPASAEAAAPAQPAGKPSVTGKVVFKGEAPEPEQINMGGVPECASQHADGVFAEALVVNGNGTLKNVLVRVSAGLPAGQEFAVPSTPVKLDQRGCQYHPHVVGMMVGQPMTISNGDNFLHNVHALSNVNPAFNFGQPTKDEQGRKVDPLKAPEVFKVKCDVHPWMGAFVHVMEHPFFSVTGDDGTFTLTGLPPGTYTVTAWHETLGEQQQQQDVKVEEGKPASIEFTFEAK